MTTPELPPYLTLDEAAKTITKRLGEEWTARDLIGYAYRNEISIFARISTDAKMVRVEPIEGEKNIVIAEAGSLPRIGANACNTLLLAGEAEFTELTYPRTVNLLGQPVEAMVTVWKLAEGETAPIFRIDDCRLSSDGVLQLINKQTKTVIDLPKNQDYISPAKTELIKGEPSKIIKRTFAGLHFNSDQWGRNLSDPPKWLEPCRVSIGSKGKRVSHTWNPVLIGIALIGKTLTTNQRGQITSLTQKIITIEQVDLKFMQLKDWSDKWQEETEPFR
jgi:hypothetical protein